ncbi:MAG: redoxin domain-containing protein [Myxococcales bacterium]|nr:redoxin domain-containing protein [Myxococcales bacterium]MCB9716480.1 redoxin domain-containing protein [Myxococcales bacterium]
MKRWVTLAGVLGLALGAAACRLQTEAPPAAVERTAPDFSLTAHDGSSVSLARLLERGPAILVFYRGHW